MENIILKIIQILLVIAIIYVVGRLFISIKQGKKPIGSAKKIITGFFIGFFTDMLDTWGIGSFALTTTLFKTTKFHDDDLKLPGTMNFAHAIPVIVESLFFVTAVKVEISTLIPMTTAAILGAIVGPRITKNWNIRLVRRVLGFLLLAAAIVIIYRMATNIGANVSESSHGLSLPWLIGGVIFNFILGNLMTMGLGNYAPELVFFSIAGVNPMVALPVMMLDAAMIMTFSIHQFIRQNRIYWEGLIGIIIGGVLGVVFAAKIVTSINMEVFKIATVIIVTYTAATLIYESFKGNKAKA